MLSTAFNSLVSMMRARPVVRDATIAELRDRFERMTPLLGAPPSGVRITQEILAGRNAERYTPVGAPNDAVVLFFHGGGYCIGSLNTHRSFVARLAEASGVTWIAFDYRLAPEHRFPGAVDDAMAAYRALRREGHTAKRIVIAGDSAGGGLTLAAIAALRDSGDALPVAGVCLSPWTDLAMAGASIDSKAPEDPMLAPWELHAFARHYLNGADARNSLASPLYADYRGFPPLLIHVGDAEILRDDSTRLAQRARDAGVAVTFLLEAELVHVWHFFAALIPEGEDGLRKVGEYVRAKVGER
ncbi:MAG: alpha/beta hydrolase [Candidatus Hydrogenedentes bacterium]|nr:alpha/beta hydrolase [Candidatus Hydrogenedentota bacterium]